MAKVFLQELNLWMTFDKGCFENMYMNLGKCDQVDLGTVDYDVIFMW